MNYFERRFIPLVYRAIRSQIRSAVADMKANSINEAKKNIDKTVLNERIYDAVARLYKTVGVFFANDTYSKIQAQVPTKGFGFNTEWVNEIIEYFKLFLLNKATFPITETTREWIRQIFIQGEQDGEGVDVIARRLLETNTPLPQQITMHRARMIVRTESAKAAFKGREMGKAKSEYALTTEWIAANDHRTRHSHRLMDGIVNKEGEKFVVPRYKGKIQIGVDLMTGPGDPEASKENVINCRCTTSERVVFDAENNPVMKRQNVLI